MQLKIAGVFLLLFVSGSAGAFAGELPDIKGRGIIFKKDGREVQKAEVGDTIEIGYHLSNPSKSDTGPFSAQILCPSCGEFDPEEIDGMDAGGHYTVYATVRPDKSGSVEFRGNADILDEVEEQDERNNNSRGVLEVTGGGSLAGPQADLAAGDLIFKKDGTPVQTVSPGDRIDAELEVRNLLGKDVESVVVQFLVRGETKRIIVEGIAQGASATAQWPMTVNWSGREGFNASVDPDNEIEETDENNNRASASLNVGTKGVDLRAKDLRIMSNGVSLEGFIPFGMPCRAEAVVEDLSEHPVSQGISASVDFGGDVSEEPMEARQDGRDWILIHPKTFRETGPVTITMQVDFREQYEETDEGNNVLTKEFEVKPYDLSPAAVRIKRNGREVQEIIEGIRYTLELEIRQEGTPAHSLADYTLTIGDYEVPSSTLQIRPLEVLKEKEYRFSEPGTQTIRFELDPEDKLLEVDEENNVYEGTVEVVGLPPDTLVAADILIHEENSEGHLVQTDVVTAGKEYTVDFMASNASETDLTVVLLRMDVGGEVAEERMDIEAGGTNRLFKPHVFSLTPGEVSIKVEVDPNEEIGDRNRRNNQTERTVRVQANLPEDGRVTESAGEHRTEEDERVRVKVPDPDRLAEAAGNRKILE